MYILESVLPAYSHMQASQKLDKNGSLIFLVTLDLASIGKNGPHGGEKLCWGARTLDPDEARGEDSRNGAGIAGLPRS